MPRHILKRLAWGALALALLAACAVPLSVARPDTAELNPSLPLPTAAAVTLNLNETPAELPADAAPVALEDSLLVFQWLDEDRHQLTPVHPLTGEPLPGYTPLAIEGHYSAAFASAGRVGALLIHPPGAYTLGRLHLLNLAAWTLTPTEVEVGSRGQVLRFSPDGQRLLLADTVYSQHHLYLIDTATGAVLAETPTDFQVTDAAFAPDGSLMVYGQHYAGSAGFNREARAASLSGSDLRVLWQATLDGVRHGQYVDDPQTAQHTDAVWYQPVAAFAPGGTALYLVHADADRLTTVDFAAQSVSTVPIQPAQSLLDRLMALTAGVAEAKVMNGTIKSGALSPDGRHLYVTGQTYTYNEGQYGDSTVTTTPLGLLVIDTATGAELQRLDTPAASVALSPDGQRLLLNGWEPSLFTEVWSLDGARPSAVHRVAGHELRPLTLMNGDTYLLAQRDRAGESRVLLLNDRLEVAANWTLPGYSWLVSF